MNQRADTPLREQLTESGVNELLAQVDFESERFRNVIVELMAKTAALCRSESRHDQREELVCKLRDANQNLVLSIFATQDLHAKAEANNQRQKEFLAMLAHELRNPMAPVVLACDILGKIANTHPQLPKLHQIIHRQISHMTHLVDDLMDASRISTGKISLHRQDISVADLIESAVETSQPYVDRYGHALTVTLPDNPAVIEGDLMRLSQVLSNLIINACKFTPKGGNIVLAERRVPGADPAAVEISVKDNGAGISKEYQSAIFELFAQGVSSPDRPQGGLGIGLAIARSIVEMHGGSIGVESAGAGQGSEFIVSLPVATGGGVQEPAQIAVTSASRQLRILLINDYADINETLTELLEAEGHTVASTFDVLTGLTLAQQQDYDVVVCDTGLQALNGYELATKLRADKSKPVPCLIAMSGYDQSVGRAIAMEAGFDHYLVKPVDFADLGKLFQNSLSR